MAFTSEQQALNTLGTNFRHGHGIVTRIDERIAPTQQEHAALGYLMVTHDYGYYDVDPAKLFH